MVVESNDEYIIEDWDVASYYPNLAIKNKLAPAHLGETFCEIYEDIYNQRKGYAKGTAENAMLKLALNGVYGDSNSQYSPFYDPKFTMSITINGQLLLCMLAEKLMNAEQVEMIQINTHGLTVRYPRWMKEWVHSVCQWWQDLTKLTLEDVEYNCMFIRDVNNYIGEYTDGKVKRKGAYEYELGWHQNHSALVVPKAAEAALIHGKDIRYFIEHHSDVMDFMLRAKVPRSTRLEWGGEQIQNTTRYYVSTDGDILEKVMPAKGPVGSYKRASGVPDHFYNQVIDELIAEVSAGFTPDTAPSYEEMMKMIPWDERIHTKNKSTHEERRTGICTGYTVKVANRIPDIIGRVMSEDFDGDGGDIADYEAVVDGYFNTINYEWYIAEAEKLVNPLL